MVLGYCLSVGGRLVCFFFAGKRAESHFLLVFAVSYCYSVRSVFCLSVQLIAFRAESAASWFIFSVSN